MFSKNIQIENKNIGSKYPIYIIAEAGVSHFGDEHKAYQLVDLAVSSGADAVKFQVFNIDSMISRGQAEWRERMGSRQLPYDSFERIQKYCQNKKITFFATAHDEPSLDFLVSIKVPMLKIGSGELGNWPFISRIASLGKPVIISTGMYQMNDIGHALEIIRKTGNRDVVVLHCITSYPTPASDVSLGNIAVIRERFDVIAGYSDHTEGFHIPMAAAALGARVIEKHITLEYNIPNAQDWKVSCGPADLSVFIKQTRDIEAALTVRDTGPTNKEVESKVWATKSLVAARDLVAGTIVSVSDFVAKRPGTGISPADIDKVLGKKLKVGLTQDDILKWENLD